MHPEVLECELRSGAGAVALASIPDANGIIHGCRHDNTGALRVIDTATGQKGVSLETALNWNQTGPQGPASSNSFSSTIVTVSVPVDPGTFNQATASCPPGHVVTVEGLISSEVILMALTRHSLNATLGRYLQDGLCAVPDGVAGVPGRPAAARLLGVVGRRTRSGAPSVRRSV
jgi:hypothetical protein